MTARLPVFGREPLRRWTPPEDAVLDSTPSNVEAAALLDRTVDACESRRLARRKAGDAPPAAAPAGSWTPDEDALLSAGLAEREIHERTGRSFAAIKARRVRLRAGAKR